MADLETRSVQLDARAIEGYAVVWNSRSLALPLGNGKSFTELVAPGAFTSSLATRSQALLWEHDRSRPLATVRAGTLELAEDGTGLRFKADLPDTNDGRDARTMVEDGILDQLSFGFRVERDTWHGAERTIHAAELIEISLVHDPAYPDTSAVLRSLSHAAASRLVAMRLRHWRQLLRRQSWRH